MDPKFWAAIIGLPLCILAVVVMEWTQRRAKAKRFMGRDDLGEQGFLDAHYKDIAPDRAETIRKFLRNLSKRWAPQWDA